MNKVVNEKGGRFVICTKGMCRSVMKKEWIESRLEELSMYNRKSGKGERRQ